MLHHIKNAPRDTKWRKKPLRRQERQGSSGFVLLGALGVLAVFSCSVLQTLSAIANMSLIMEKEVRGKIGDSVQESGSYVCDNCGHYQYFDKGDQFEDCQTCNESDITWELE